MEKPYDVCIVGPGPAGSACAIELARAGLRVALVGPTIDEAHRNGEVISPRARRQISAVDAFSGIPIRFVCSRWSGKDADIFDLKLSTGRPAMSAVRPALDRKLVAEACAVGAHYIPAAVRATLRDQSLWHIELSGSAGLVPARFVVEATGRSTRSRFCANVRRHFLDALVVLWCTVESAHENGDGMLELAPCRIGWWYRVPIGSGRSFLALATDADIIPPDGRHSFFERCARDTVFEIDATMRQTPLRIADGRSSLRMPQFFPGWIPIGDAAFSLDPLSGDGVARALADGIEIAQLLISKRSDIGFALDLDPLITKRMYHANKLLKEKALLYLAGDRWPGAHFWSRRVLSS
ncbi:hypothetical protein B5P46_25185 [Rhizobium leguminosarum]|uniref:FAD/NAD(P)-binding domain-containing protein n=1 Tax=Rhizobium leguminosarum TaxID=384 RepID=A0A4Q1TNJ2_RHILE|nr:FAD-dependent oxidoreductase [Rhizobium leguminosarum]RXT19605.1 hypothetical protein B5P46_25185 [Rhizobium leguminosarum]